MRTAATDASAKTAGAPILPIPAAETLTVPREQFVNQAAVLSLRPLRQHQRHVPRSNIRSLPRGPLSSEGSDLGGQTVENGLSIPSNGAVAGRFHLDLMELRYSSFNTGTVRFLVLQEERIPGQILCN